MWGLKITQENLTNQQGVVKNEVKVNVLNQPYGGFPWLDLPQHANTNWFNAHNFYGDLEHISTPRRCPMSSSSSRPTTRRTMPLVVSGDIDTQQTLEWIRKYFSGIPASKLPAQPDISEPRQEKEKRANREDPLANRPRSRSGITSRRATRPSITPWGSSINCSCRARTAASISRWWKRGLTGSVSGGTNPLLGNMFDIKGPTLWMVWLIHDADKKADDIIQAIDEEITRLQTTPVTQPSSSSRS